MTLAIDDATDDLSLGTRGLVTLLDDALGLREQLVAFADVARSESDPELAAFFEEMALNACAVTARARLLLSSRL